MFTKDELGLILEAIAQQIVSAQRAQANKRGTPIIREVYQKHEQVLATLKAKVLEHLTKTK